MAKRVRHYARRAYRYIRRRSGKSKKMSLSMIGALGLGLNMPIQRVIQGKITGADSAIDWLSYNYTGFHTGGTAGAYSFDMNGLKNGALPLLAGVIVHKIAGKMGVNRALHALPFFNI